MDKKTYDGRKMFNRCVRCGEFVERVKHHVTRALTGYLTAEQVSNLDATLAEEFEPADPSGDYSYVRAEDACPTCIVRLMAANV